MQISEQEIQSKLGYTEEELKPILVTNLSMFTQSGLSPTDEPVIDHLAKYIYALVKLAYEKGKNPVGDDTEKIPIEIASHEIWTKYIGQSWFQAVGIGKDELIIYTSTKKYPVSFTEYNGIPVKFKYMGKVRAQ